MSINAYNASTISALFAGLNNSSSGTSLSYGIDFTTYNSIKNGSYSKLMRKYYSNQRSFTIWRGCFRTSHTKYVTGRESFLGIGLNISPKTTFPIDQLVSKLFLVFN